MAFMGCSGYGAVTVSVGERADRSPLIVVRVEHSTLGMSAEEATQLHMQLGEVLSKLRASNDEGPTAPAGIAA